MLVAGLFFALVIALGYIAYDKIRIHNQKVSYSQKIDSNIKPSIEQRDNELIILALGKLTDTEFTAVMHGNIAILAAKIDEEKRKRIPDYDFKVDQWQAAVQGIEAARLKHLSSLKSGYPLTAESALNSVHEMQDKANMLRRELDEF